MLDYLELFQIIDQRLSSYLHNLQMVCFGSFAFWAVNRHFISFALRSRLLKKHNFLLLNNFDLKLTAINVKSHNDVIDWCKSNDIKLVVIGPEDYLADGFSDALNGSGIYFCYLIFAF